MLRPARPGAQGSLLPHALGVLVLALVPTVMVGRGGTRPGKGVGERGRRPWDTCVLLKLQKQRGYGWEDTHVAVKTEEKENSVNDIIPTIPFSMKNYLVCIEQKTRILKTIILEE